MQKKNGFTLLEVLIVVVIAVSVAAFAVPAYKKTQEKNKYLAAQGVLLDLGTAVRTVQASLSGFPAGGSSLQVTAEMQSVAGETPSERITLFNADREMFRRQYMTPIPFDSGDTYKGYAFYICPHIPVEGDCCNSDKEVVACMLKTTGEYKGARFKTDGSLERI